MLIAKASHLITHMGGWCGLELGYRCVDFYTRNRVAEHPYFLIEVTQMRNFHVLGKPLPRALAIGANGQHVARDAGSPSLALAAVAF